MQNQLLQEAHEFRHFSKALYAALATDPFYIAMERSVEPAQNAKEAMLCYYDYSILEAKRFGYLRQPKETPFGVSVWSLPLEADTARLKNDDKKKIILQAMGEKSVQIYQEINAFMAASSAPLISDRDWYLSILGILPNFQGKGLGADLVTPVLREADKAGLATYLETFTPRNMPFYERLGYEAVASFKEPVTQSDYWVMRRPER